MVLAVVLMLVAVMAGCSGNDAQAGSGINGPPLASGTPAGSHTVTITGAAGNLQNSTNVTLVVQ